MFLIFFEGGRTWVIGVPGLFQSYQRGGHDIRATKRYYDRFASVQENYDNHEGLIKASIILAGQKNAC